MSNDKTEKLLTRAGENIAAALTSVRRGDSPYTMYGPVDNIRCAHTILTRLLDEAEAALKSATSEKSSWALPSPPTPPRPS